MPRTQQKSNHVRQLATTVDRKSRQFEPGPYARPSVQGVIHEAMSSAGLDNSHSMNEHVMSSRRHLLGFPEGGLHAACKRQMRRDRTESLVNEEMPSPRGVPKSMLTSPHVPLPEGRGNRRDNGVHRRVAGTPLCAMSTGPC